MGVVYLALIILCGTGLTLACKWASRKGSSPLGLVTVVQVVVAAALVAAVCIRGGSWSRTLVLLGAAAGVGGTLGFLLTVQALRIGHYAFTNSIVGACFLASVVFSAIFWERIGPLEVAGVLVITSAVAMITFSSSSDRGEHPGRWGRWALLAAGGFLFSALGQISNAAAARAFATSGGLPMLEFLTVCYLTGAVVLLPVNIIRGEFSRRTVLYGLVGAAASLVGAAVLLLVLMIPVPESVVFPVSVSGGLFVSVLLSRLLFRERIGPLGYAGIAVEVAGVVLLAFAMAHRAA